MLSFSPAECNPCNVDESFLPTDSPRQGSLTRLLEVAVRLGVEHDLDRILRIATQGVCEAVGCDRASLFLADNSQRELVTRVVTELEIAEIRHPFDRGIIGWVATSLELLCVPDPHQDARWDSSVDRRTGFRTQNILAAPILSVPDRRLLGVLQLLNKPEGFDALDEQLVQAFAAHVAIALERCRLEEEVRRHAALRQTLETARKIQSSLLPSALPMIPRYEVAAWWQPAEFVSGDYYDWLPQEHGNWSFVIGDVSGHGLAAALLMASVRAMARVLSQTETDPRTFVEILRESIEPDLSTGRFITFLCATIDPQTHMARLWNAGHGPAYIVRAATGECEKVSATATPLGFPHLRTASAATSVEFAPGDILLMGTDGVIEVPDSTGSMFGSGRLLEIVRAHRHQPASEIVNAVATTVQAYHGLEVPPDDTTLVIVRRQSVTAR